LFRIFASKALEPRFLVVFSPDVRWTRVHPVIYCVVSRRALIFPRGVMSRPSFRKDASKFDPHVAIFPLGLASRLVLLAGTARQTTARSLKSGNQI